MAGWMTDHMPNSDPMGGPMMGGPWDSPQAMRDWCTQAMGGQAGVDNPTAWCDQMVGWMSDHMGNWDDWHDDWHN